MTGEAMRMPSHGKSGSESGLQSAKASLFSAAHTLKFAPATELAQAVEGDEK